MTERLFGVETEYALTPLGSDGVPLDRGIALRGFMNMAKRQLPYLRDRNSEGFFLGNGSRFYVDCGLHPELSTPECANPWDAVRYVLAGEQILAGLAAELVAQERQIAEVVLLKCNVDYSGTGSTWGCHESYLHQADPQALPNQIIPHLVSRVIYTGAGGFNPVSQRLDFSLSPRVSHLIQTVSSASTRDRGIFHTKDESLCGKGYHRLHILCGESLCSETASWLKIGVTALVVAMIEAGVRPGDAVELPSPVDVMQSFARDETCSSTAKGTNGRSLSAIEIQRHYLDLAEAHQHEPFMPSWAGDVLAVWRAILDRLEQGAPDSVATVLDWAIKCRLYRDRLQQRGKTWKSATPVHLRRELFEIDARFGQLGPRGIFTAMDRAGVLDHGIPGVDNIEHAVSNPPAVGRARLRGEWVKRFSGKQGRYVSDWQGVWDFERKRFLDLSNPFESEEHWREGTVHDRSSRRDWLLEALARPRRQRRARHTPEGFYVGQQVILGGADAVDGSESHRSREGWVSDMERYLGQTATIVRILRHAGPGCSVVQVDVDGGRCLWRTANLRPASQESSAPA